MGTLAAPMASVAKSVTAHSQRFSPIIAMRSPFCAPQSRKLGQGADPLINLIRGNGPPAPEFILPEDRVGIGGGGHAEEQDH